ncbi:MAG: FixH family protein [Bdellovibrionaceae bacterium]|nr:FixH family protein [Pseudobdellovibrionaceae bacterium]MCO5114609.1 FixH family protein [Pseudobdellovibrionaceae bacterium]
MKISKVCVRAILAMTVVWGVFIGQVLAHSGHVHAPSSSAPMVHLTFAQAGVHAHVMWELGPVVGAESRLRVEWKSALDHSSVSPSGDFEVVLWMPSMNHGSAPTLVQNLVDENGKALIGVYEVSNIYFVMGGDWEVRLTLIGADGTFETQTFALDVLEDSEAPSGHGNPHSHGGGDSHHHGHH